MLWTRNCVHEVRERLDYKGDVILPIDVGDVERAVTQLLKDGVEAIAVVLEQGLRVRPEPELRRLQPGDALDHQTSCAKQDERQGHLSNDHQASQREAVCPPRD